MADTGPPRPPHFYNSRRQPQTIHTQYVANTTEDIDSSRKKGISGSGLLYILLIGFTALILITGMAVGCYFLFRNVKHNFRSDVLNQMSDEDTSDDSGSPDSTDERQGKQKKIKFGTIIAAQSKTAKSQTISVNQIYFKNTEQNLYDEFVGYIPKNDMEYAYDSLLTLEGIAKLFEMRPWIIETRDPTTTSNLCQYFRTTQNTKYIAPISTFSNSVDLCRKEFKLKQFNNDRLRFLVFSNSNNAAAAGPCVILQLQAMVFKIDNDPKTYTLTHSNLQHIALLSASDTKRRLTVSNMPSTNDILQNKKLWMPLPANYRGRTYHALLKLAETAPIQQPNPRLPVEEAMNGLHHHCAIDPSQLARLYFVKLDFILTKDSQAWNCQYQSAESRVLGSSAETSADPQVLSEQLRMAEKSLREPLLTPLQQRRSLAEPPNVALRSPGLDTMAVDVANSQKEEIAEPPPQKERRYQSKPPPPIDTNAEPPQQEEEPPIHIPKDPVILLDEWWNKIVTDPHTQCRKEMVTRSVQPCTIIGGNEGGGCDEWEIMDNGRKMVNPYEAIEAVGFKGILKYDVYPYIVINRIMDRYEVDTEHKLIHTNGAIPFWGCRLLPDGDGRRVLMDDRHASKAWHQENMYMIIGSTMFFIVIGVQSFYWLSH